ncbi:hypothetical protein F8S13_01770 [Chloroflexia bacterium SDU3-3]|nr:hypothetical protein F8S13_01770 [Chloroflexia bacterium SDU3-3]
MLAACAAPAAPPQASVTATATPTPTPAHAAAGIQQTLDRYTQAYNQNDQQLLTQIIDPQRLPFRRFTLSNFTSFQSSWEHDRARASLKLLGTTPLSDGLVLAHIQASNGNLADWPLRQVDGQWLLSEPSKQQLGTPSDMTIGHITFTTYPWADDINQEVIDLMRQAQHDAADRLGKDTDTKLNVIIKPSFELSPFENAGYVAVYKPNYGPHGHDLIEIFAPHTYMFGFYGKSGGWQRELRQTLTHEYAHMIHKRVFGNVGYFTGWMTEGLATYVSQEPIGATIRRALSSHAIIPLIDKQHSIDKYDLMHMRAITSDRPQAYALAASVVAYIDERYHGLDSFWKMARNYQDSQDIDQAMRDALGTSADDFERDWETWLAKTYAS